MSCCLIICFWNGISNFSLLFSEISGAKLIRRKNSKTDFCHILTLKKLLAEI